MGTLIGLSSFHMAQLIPKFLKMINLIIDTNTWLYMANGYNQETAKYDNGYSKVLVDKLTKLVELGKVTLIVNSVIITEWERNREIQETAIARLEKNIESAKNSIAGIKKKVSSRGSKRADRLFEEYRASLELEIQNNKKHIAAVEDLLFNRSLEIPIDDSTRVEVTKLATDKKAPFHNKANSVGDAIILLSAVKHFESVYSDFDWLETTFFISNNSDDYCEKKGSRKVHPDLEGYFQKSAIKFEPNLAKALEMSQEAIDKVEEYLRYEESLEPCEASCKGSEWGLDNVSYDHITVRVLDAVDVFVFDPDQAQIDFPNSKKITKEEVEKISAKSEVEIDKGDCSFCGVTHIKCVCETIHLMDQTDGELSCDCGRVIYIKDSDIVGVSEGL